MGMRDMGASLYLGCPGIGAGGLTFVRGSVFWRGPSELVRLQHGKWWVMTCMHASVRIWSFAMSTVDKRDKDLGTFIAEWIAVEGRISRWALREQRMMSVGRKGAGNERVR